ncbi:MAG TPA: dihydrofolate reductase, partial [Caulobacteraceae bacterium]|nr:dihydrofolate reductase [Caulobacteraceae bacterium]
WESLPKRPLPGRLNVVITRDASYGETPAAKGALVCEDFTDAVDIAREQAADEGAEEICVIGGAALFALALPKAKRIYLTEVEADVAGDVMMPPFDEAGWRETRRETHPAGEGDDFAFTFRVLERR